MSVRGAIGTRRRRIVVAERRVDRARRRLLGDPSLGERDREILGRAYVGVDPHDAMHVGDSDHYLRVGLSALRCVEATGDGPPRRVLDLPCGHGRVLRMLRAAYPEAELVACDIDRHGVDFCAARFGAAPLYSADDLDAVALPDAVDLVWCGSLVTHLDAERSRLLLERLCATLAPGGRLVFTTHGRLVAEQLERAEAGYQLDDEARRAVLAGYRGSGFGYAGYPWSPDYGISLTAPDWVEASAPFPVVHHAERGWADHQDVFTLRRP